MPKVVSYTGYFIALLCHPGCHSTRAALEIMGHWSPLLLGRGEWLDPLSSTELTPRHLSGPGRKGMGQQRGWKIHFNTLYYSFILPSALGLRILWRPELSHSCWVLAKDREEGREKVEGYGALGISGKYDHQNEQWEMLVDLGWGSQEKGSCSRVGETMVSRGE